LLFDAGRGVATQLARVDVAPEQLDAVFVTHHHFDHIGGLGDLLMAAWNRGLDQRLPVFGPRGTGAIVATLFNGLYQADIRFRIREAEANGAPIAHVAEMVQATDIESGVVALGAGVQVEVGRVEHGESGIGLAEDEWTALGYRIDGDGGVVTITGDAVAGRDLARLAHEADVLVINCYLAGDEIDSEETRFLSERVLAGGPQVARIAADARCRKVVLTHLRQKSPALLESLVAEIRQVYAGEVIVGEDLFTLGL
jgi:ribonuclease Z